MAIANIIINENEQCQFMGVSDEMQFSETNIALDLSNELLDVKTYIEIIKFDIDPFMINKFWQSIFQNRFVHVDKAILEWLGYSDKRSFKKILESHNINFKEIKNDDPEFQNYSELVEEIKTMTIQALSSKKWIIIDNPDDFKYIIMCIQTERASDIRRYYCNLEKLFKMYCEYTSFFKTRILEQQLKEKDIQIEEEKQVTLNLKKLTISRTKKECTEIIYISTSENYARQNRFKVGGVESIGKLKSRLSQYNGRSGEGDEWYYSDIFRVSSYRNIEEIMKTNFTVFLDKKKKEIYTMHYTYLRKYVKLICAQHVEVINKVNDELDDIINGTIDMRNLRPVVPPPLKFSCLNITNADDKGNIENTIILDTEDHFKEKVLEYVNSLKQTKNIFRTQIFDAIPMKVNKNEAWKWIKEIISESKPELINKLQYR